MLALAVQATCGRAFAAGGAERFIAWFGAHPEVSFVSVVSRTTPPSPFDLRFSRPRQEPGGHALPSQPALVRIGDSAGVLVCLVAMGRSVCARAPASREVRALLIRNDAKRVHWRLVIGPSPEGRVVPYDLTLPDGIAREGRDLPANPRWHPEPAGPWWRFELEGGGPFKGNPARALKGAPPVATVPGPDWLQDTNDFSVLATGDPRALRLESDAGTSVCLHGARWTCHALPATPSLDDVHPGLPPTNSALTSYSPPVFRIQTGAGDPTKTSLAVERHWIRSQHPHTPSMEFTGTFVELLRPGAGGGFERQAVLETMYGRLTRIESPAESGFLIAGSVTDRCIDLISVDKVPPKMIIAPPGRYCLGAGGRMVRTP